MPPDEAAEARPQQGDGELCSKRCVMRAADDGMAECKSDMWNQSSWSQGSRRACLESSTLTSMFLLTHTGIQ